jgi:hypothetical protein
MDGGRGTGIGSGAQHMEQICISEQNDELQVTLRRPVLFGPGWKTDEMWLTNGQGHETHGAERPLAFALALHTTCTGVGVLARLEEIDCMLYG